MIPNDTVEQTWVNMRKRGGLWLRDVGLYAHRAQHAILFLIVYVQILHDNAIKRNHLEILKKKKKTAPRTDTVGYGAA